MSYDPWWRRVLTNVSLLVVAVVFCVVSLRGRTTVQQGARALHANRETGNMLSRVSRPSIGTTNGVVVLGMHRSGTSMLTGLMGEMRLHLGPQASLLPPANGINEKGFFERTQIVLQNSELMSAQNVSWNSNVTQFDHLTALKDALTDTVGFGLGREALAYYNNPMYQPWVVKDPRLCVTLRFWLNFWTTPPAVVLTYRHPVEVAESLARRDNFGMRHGFCLWIAYSRAAIQNSVGLCRIITSYSALIQDGPGALRLLYDQLRGCGVDVPRMATASDVEKFIDPSLRHHTHEPKRWKSEAVDDLNRAQEDAVLSHALRLYRAMEDGSAFSPQFEWDNLEDTLSC